MSKICKPVTQLYTKQNVFTLTDCYKLLHLEQYVPGTTKVYSYLQARSNRKYNHSVFFGLQYYLKKYLCKPITNEDIDEFLLVRNKFVGPANADVENKMRKLADLGYWPLRIKAVPEGSVVPIKNMLMSITNTHPDFYWTVGFLESLLLQLWYPCTVATTSLSYRKLVNHYFKKTVDDDVQSQDFMVHDFGFRGDSSPESSEISGLSHLTCFKGSDTVVAYNAGKDYYNHNDETDGILLASVPASEHSVMCSFGRDNELEAFQNMLRLYPSGIVSIVSDTYDVYNVVTKFATILKDQIMSRDGITVFRPDSGNPEYIICGDPTKDPNSNEGKGCLRLLDEVFGSKVNSKGFKVLNKVALIYGDGMYLERYEKVLSRLVEMGYSVQNLVIGVGGILRYHSRDTLGFAIKATKVVVDGKEKSIMKDPITDSGKRSHQGYLRLDTKEDATTLENYFTTIENVSEEEEGGYLQTVFEDGKLLIDDNMKDVRSRTNNYLEKYC